MSPDSTDPFANAGGDICPVLPAPMMADLLGVDVMNPPAGLEVERVLEFGFFHGLMRSAGLVKYGKRRPTWAEVDAWYADQGLPNEARAWQERQEKDAAAHRERQVKAEAALAALEEKRKAGNTPPGPEEIRALFEGDPVPLTNHSLDLPPFPVNALPPAYRDMVEAVAVMYQVDTAMSGPMALAVLASACGGCVEAKIREGWQEVTALHILVTADPSERKSPTLRAMIRPLEDAQRGLVRDVMPRRIEAEALRDVAKQAANKAKNEAAKLAADPTNPAAVVKDQQDHAVKLAQELSMVSVPAIPRLLADDVTPAALGVVMAENRGRIAVMSAEGGVFKTLMGKYSKDSADVELWLKGYSGDSHRDDRVSRASVDIERAVLTALLMMQPYMLAEVTGNPELRGRGVLARAMYALPTSLVGRRDHRSAPVPAEVSARYHVEVRELAQVLHAAEGDPVVVEFSPEAEEAMVAYLGELEPRLVATDDLGGALAAWGGKLAGTVGRIATLLHMGEHGPEGVHKPVDVRHVRDAIRIGAFFNAHADAAFGRGGVRAGDTEGATTVWEKLCELHSRSPYMPIGRRDLMRKGGVAARYRPLSELAPILDLLADHHLVVLQEFRPERGGPAQTRIWVNPDAVG